MDKQELRELRSALIVLRAECELSLKINALNDAMILTQAINLLQSKIKEARFPEERVSQETHTVDALK